MLASLAFNLLETGGHDRVGHDQAAARARRPARARLEPRLADLDRAAAAVLRPDRAAQRRRSARARRSIVAGLAGAAATLAGLLLPGMQAVDRSMAGAAQVGVQT